MTDHSILTHGIADLPFQREARAVTRFLAALAGFPRAVAQAFRAQAIIEELVLLDAPQLAALGIDRMGVTRYAAIKAGILADEAER
ncbi:MAG TPA: hypothetical protein VGC25_04640 [Alphaproteobacteria bacterium]|jgi:hypothetical protein